MALRGTRRTEQELKEAFRQKVEVDPVTGCWTWTGAKDDNGDGLLFIGGKGTRVHRLAWEWAMGQQSARKLARTCCTPRCTNPAHLAEGYRVGDRSRCKPRHPSFGEQHWNHKLTAAQVRSIRRQYKDGSATLSDLAARFGVALSTISAIERGQLWRQVR